MNSPFGVGFALSSTERGPDEGSVPAIISSMTKPLKSWNIKIPRIYAEAMTSPYKKEWYNAMEVQIDKLIAAKAFEIVPQPLSRSTILPGKWVFDLKIDKDNNVLEFRAR